MLDKTIAQIKPLDEAACKLSAETATFAEAGVSDKPE